jgi:hypothetical protein
MSGGGGTARRRGVHLKETSTSSPRTTGWALQVRLRSGPYAEDWLATGTIWLDAGQLDAVARDAAVLASARG